MTHGISRKSFFQAVKQPELQRLDSVPFISRRHDCYVENVLLLSRYGNLGASSRIRSYQYLAYLREQGIEAGAAGIRCGAPSRVNKELMVAMNTARFKRYDINAPRLGWNTVIQVVSETLVSAPFLDD